VAEDDEIVAELTERIEAWVADGSLELASRRDVRPIATKLCRRLQRAPGTDVGEWLLEQVAVSELFLDSDELARQLQPIVARLRGGEPPQCWNAELAEAVLAASDDAGPRMVLADWLQEAGDPRGELMALQLRLATTPDDAQLLARERRLFERHRRHFFGALEPDRGSVVWRAGFIDTVRCDVADLVAILGHPSLRMLRTLAVYFSGDQLEQLARLQLPPTLTTLELRGQVNMRGQLALPALLRGLPALARLVVLDGPDDTVLDRPELPQLRVLSFAGVPPRLAVSGPWAPADWTRRVPALEELTLDRAPIAPEQLGIWWDLVRYPPPGLRVLRLVRCDNAAEWLDRMLASPLLDQLRTLDLRNSGTAPVALLLAAHAQRFGHLELLQS